MPAPELEKILKQKIVAILRGVQPTDTTRIIDALIDGGITVLEITLNSPGALDTIQHLCKRNTGKLLVGAGTVLTEDDAAKAIEAGARFIISPSYDAGIIAITKKLNAISIPGAFTATEIIAAHRNGADIVKVFPASVGSQYIKDLRGPLPHIPMMPTGGIHLQNVKEFFQAGAAAVGIGSALVDPKQKITDQWLNDLTNKAALFVKAASEFSR